MAAVVRGGMTKARIETTSMARGLAREEVRRQNNSWDLEVLEGTVRMYLVPCRTLILRRWSGRRRTLHLQSNYVYYNTYLVYCIPHTAYPPSANEKQIFQPYLTYDVALLPLMRKAFVRVVSTGSQSTRPPPLFPARSALLSQGIYLIQRLLKYCVC